MKFLHDFARHLMIIITMMPFLVTEYYDTPKQRQTDRRLTDKLYALRTDDHQTDKV